MDEVPDRNIVQCEKCGGISLAQIKSDGTIRIPGDLSLGGCETHEFVALNGEIVESNENSATLDILFDLLSKERRRYVLYYLRNQDGPVTIHDVAEQVSEWESKGAPEAIPPDADRIEITLKHNHLPKLESAESIEYDPNTQSIHLRGPSPAFEAILMIAKLVDKPGEDN